jgi:uncharacterized repeat protein (TIGR03803 family)
VAGTVFELSPSGGGWVAKTIYDVGSVGAVTGLAMDAAGNIFGTANEETVYELSPNGRGGWHPTLIHTFPAYLGDVAAPSGTLVLDQAGNLYGTSLYGGAQNCGAVYELSPGKKTGKWTETILYSFKGGQDGCNPEAGVVFDAAGNIYGTTTTSGDTGAGTVFELMAQGSYQERVLWSIPGYESLAGALVLDSAENLFGTTPIGGAYGEGTLFEVIQ